MKKIMMIFTMCLLVVSGCSSKGNDVKDVKLKDLMDTVLTDEAYEIPATMEIDDETLKNVYQISPDDVEQHAIAFPLMNVQATELIMIEAKDGKLDTVKKALDARMKTLEETWGQYLPDQLELVKNHKVIEKGNYMIIIIADKAEDITKVIDKAFA